MGRRSEGHFGDWTVIPDTKSTHQMKKCTSILCVGFLSVVLISIGHKGIHKGKAKLSDTVLHLLRSTGFQTSMMVVGGLGVVGLGVQMMSYALPEMIDNWTEMIEGNHVTEASQSLRDTAYGIQETTRTLKEQIEKIKKMLQEIEQEQQKLKEIEQEQQKLKEIEQEQQKLKEIEQEQQKLKEIEQEQQKLKEIEQEQQKFKEIEQELQEIEQEQQKLKEIEQELQEIEQEQQTLQETEQDESSETEDPPAVNVGLLNVRSIKNKKEKRLEIKNLITENNLDVFLMTETWLENDTASEALSETAPPEFRFRQQPREGRGGGVAILFSRALESFSIILKALFCSDPFRFHLSCPSDFITTFEYVATALRHKEWDEDVLFINVYRSPILTQKKQFHNFVKEFTMLLKEASTDYNSIIVAGDFNVEEKRMFELVSILPDFVQHVKKPTHKKGGILDLVFSRNVDVFSVHIRDDGISDHFTVYFSIRPTSKDAKT